MNLIPDNILKKIDDETDIVALVSEFVQLERRGKNYFGLCPFHEEKTPSFSVTPEKNIAKCMGCGEGGRPINFYRKIKNIPFEQAVKELAERINLKVPNLREVKADPNEKYYELMEEANKFYSYNLFNSKSGHQALDYLKGRRLSEDTIKHFNLGYSSNNKDQLYQILRDKDYSVTDMIDLGLVKQSNDGSYYDLFRSRIMFPITNPKGRVVGFSGRSMDKNSNHKYVNSPETKIFRKGELIYHLNEAAPSIRRRRHVVLYEGFFDVISAYQADFKNGIATMGTALTINQARLIKKNTDKVIVAFDGDKAGRSAAISSIKPLSSLGLIVEILNIPEQMDPDDFIKAYGPNEFDHLFTRQSLDPYAFQYMHYKDLVNLTDANDIDKFQKQITKMLATASVSVQNIFKKRLAKDLNISEDDIKIVSKQIKQVVPPYNGPSYIPEPSPLPKKKKDRKLSTMFEQAEHGLIVAMMQKESHFHYIESQLDFQHYSNVLNGALRMKISSFYKTHSSFDLNEFMKTLEDEELTYLETKIFTTHLWENVGEVDKKEINRYIFLVQITPKLRRKTYLDKKVVELANARKNFAKEYDELIELKRYLEQIREEHNEH